VAQISLFKELIKQVSCEAIPDIGFTPDDLKKVKACASKVVPIETIDTEPAVPFDQEQLDQAECIADATEKAKKIILAEQSKLPNAIKYSALKSKIEELRDNLTAVKTYFTKRYEFFTSVIGGTQPFTAEFLYWTDEFNRLTGVISTDKTAALNANTSVSVKSFINLVADNSTDIKLQSSTVRANLVSLAADYSNLNAFSTRLGANSITATSIANVKATIQNSTQITSLLNSVRAKIQAYNSRELAKTGAISYQAQRIQGISSLSSDEDDVRQTFSELLGKISKQLSIRYDNSTTNASPTAPAKVAAFRFNLIDKNNTVVRVTQFNENDEPVLDANGNTVQADQSFQIYGNPVLQTNVFADRQGFAINGVSLWRENQYNPNAREDSDYSILTGLLYNGIPNNSYPGLYRKMAKPIKYLFTLEERGLTLNPDLIDPVLKSVKDAPLSISEDQTTFFIKNQAVYENFYETLKDQYPNRVNAERTAVFPNQIATYLNQLKELADREAAGFFRRDPASPLKLARPTSYTTSSSTSTIFNQGTFTYSTVDQSLSQILLYYTRCYEEITELQLKCDEEIERLTAKVKENAMDEQVVREKILAIPCFAKAGAATQAAAASPNNANSTDDDQEEANVTAGQESCAQKTAAKKGKDPLYFRTLSGTDASLPDLTSQCYWKEFAKALNKVCLLPFPDISGPPPTNLGFRYWPINCILPIPFGMVLLPIPPRWRSLFVLPTPLGTLVCFLTMPIAPIGIPLPSIFLFFFAVDGNKYLALATNLPILYAPPSNIKFGFVQDNSANSANPLGLTPGNPYKGQPIKGALTAPIAVNALTAKAKRLASLAAMVASGKPYITNLAGEKLPVNIKLSQLLKDMPSEAETMLNIASAPPSKDFSRQMDRFKVTINRQLDKLGNMQIAPIQTLKQQLEKKRESEEAKAFTEKNLSERRLKRQQARNIKLSNVQDKISATVKVMNTHLDNIKLGTIKYPKDPTKFNPELPVAIPALFDILELAATGDFKVDGSAVDLKTQLKRVISKISTKGLSSKKKFDLKNPADFNEFKSALKKFSKQTTGYLKGDPIKPNTSAAKTKEQAQQIAEAERAMQDKLVKAISLTAAALATPISLNIFDFGKKCCEVKAANVLSTVPLPVQLAFTLVTALMESLIDALTPNSIIKTMNLKGNVIDISQIGAMLENLINSIPKVTLPNPASLQVMILALIIPILSIISLPKAPVPLHLPTIPIVIPLDPILKPLIKKALGAVVEGAFNLLDQAGTAVLAAEMEAKAEAESMGNSTGTGSSPGPGGSNQNSTSASANLTNPNLKNNSDPGVKVINRVFKTACGDSGITATLSLESRIELNRAINTVNNLSPTDPNLSSKLTETVEPTSTSTAVLTVELPDGERFSLPKMPFVALDIGGNFDLLTGADIVELIRSIINSIFDKLINPIAKIVDIISLLSLSINTYSYTVIESSLPYVNIVKLILMAIDALIPPGIKLKGPNLEAMKIVQEVMTRILSSTESVIKEVAWIGSLAACAFGSPATLYQTTLIARLLHPIMNQDDLPPWERLTHKNPLFAIFLDEICWRGSMYSTGSLIFQSKTPAVLPYSPLFPIVHIPPHTLQP
jgi:hypothetical protein